jgi:cell shape-determining protein MreC
MVDNDSVIAELKQLVEEKRARRIRLNTPEANEELRKLLKEQEVLVIELRAENQRLQHELDLAKVELKHQYKAIVRNYRSDDIPW